VSTPFIYTAQKELFKQKAATSKPDNRQTENEECNPFGNSTEEKSESGLTGLSEYLPHTDQIFTLTVTSHKHNCTHSFSVYVAFHGELLSPLPDSIM
jgi:hypothetical protein